MGFEWLYESWVVREILRPVLDILILAFLIYRSYIILVQTRAVQLVKGAYYIAIIFFIAMVLRLNTMQWLIEMLFPGLIIALAIIFQPELRKIFTRLGQGKLFRLAPGVQRSHIDSIINSVEVLSMRHVGSLIVLCRQVGLKNVIETGTTVNAALSSSLILTIFSEGSPLHDGAIVIKGDIMEAVGCFLPLSDQTDIKRSFGTRHRAALGLAEESDAVIIVVSEETGAISLAYDAQLHYDIPAELVRRRLHQLFDIHGEEEKSIAEDTGA